MAQADKPLASGQASEALYLLPRLELLCLRVRPGFSRLNVMRCREGQRHQGKNSERPLEAGWVKWGPHNVSEFLYSVRISSTDGNPSIRVHFRAPARFRNVSGRWFILLPR